jgi:hypothetical protein
MISGARLIYVNNQGKCVSQWQRFWPVDASDRLPGVFPVGWWRKIARLEVFLRATFSSSHPFVCLSAICMAVRVKIHKRPHRSRHSLTRRAMHVFSKCFLRGFTYPTGLVVYWSQKQICRYKANDATEITEQRSRKCVFILRNPLFFMWHCVMW